MPVRIAAFHYRLACYGGGATAAAVKTAAHHTHTPRNAPCVTTRRGVSSVLWPRAQGAVGEHPLWRTVRGAPGTGEPRATDAGVYMLTTERFSGTVELTLPSGQRHPYHHRLSRVGAAR